MGGQASSQFDVLIREQVSTFKSSGIGYPLSPSTFSPASAGNGRDDSKSTKNNESSDGVGGGLSNVESEALRAPTVKGAKFKTLGKKTTTKKTKDKKVAISELDFEQPSSLHSSNTAMTPSHQDQFIVEADQGNMTLKKKQQTSNHQQQKSTTELAKALRKIPSGGPGVGTSDFDFSLKVYTNTELRDGTPSKSPLLSFGNIQSSLMSVEVGKSIFSGSTSIKGQPTSFERVALVGVVKRQPRDGLLYLQFVYKKKIIRVGPGQMDRGDETVEIQVLTAEDVLINKSTMKLLIQRIDDLSIVEFCTCELPGSSPSDCAIRLDGAISWRHKKKDM